MNTYKDPEYRGYYLAKVGAALLVLAILAVAVARYRDMMTAPAAAPATPAVVSTAVAVSRTEGTPSPVAEASGTRAIATEAPATGEAAEAETAAVRMAESPIPLEAATAAPGAVQAPATGAAEKDVAVSGTVYASTAAVSPSSLSALGTTMGAPSDYQTYTVSGSHLTANININAPSGLEISTDSATRYALPIITVSTSSLSAFSTTVGTPSTAQTYTVSGSNLTASISIHAPAGFEISKDGSTYSSYLTLTQSGGTVTTTTISVRLTGAAEGSYGGNITHTSTGAPATAAPGAPQAPAAGEPATTAPATGGLATAAPGAPQAPAAGEPATTAPATGARATTAQGAPQAPAAGEPATTAPVTGGLATAAPGAPQAPAAGEPATSAPPATVVSAAAMTGTAPISPRLIITHFVFGKAGRVTLMGTGRPNEPVEIVQGGKVIGKIVVKGDGTWTYTYVATPGARVASVQYEGQPSPPSVSEKAASPVTPPHALVPTRTPAAPSRAPTSTTATRSQAGAGQVYIVQSGDYLRKLALRFYGDEMQWSVIYNGTNAMAARDASFAEIDDPNVIVIGWKLWIPAE